MTHPIVAKNSIFLAHLDVGHKAVPLCHAQRLFPDLVLLPRSFTKPGRQSLTAIDKTVRAGGNRWRIGMQKAFGYVTGQTTVKSNTAKVGVVIYARETFDRQRGKHRADAEFGHYLRNSIDPTAFVLNDLKLWPVKFTN